MTSLREIIATLVAAGWILVRVKWDHHHFKHATNPAIVAVPHPKRDLTIGVIKSIERTTGLRFTWGDMRYHAKLAKDGRH